MYNPWKITKVWYVSYRDDDTNGDAYFAVSPVVEYWTSGGCWLLFQTEKNYISIGFDGVNIHDSNPFLGQEYDLCEVDQADDEDPIEGMETTLFVGERLIDVIKEETHYRLIFDHFEMFLSPESSSHLYYDDNAIDFPIHAFDRHIQRKCSCGGSPELMLDDRGDFYIRCDRCHKATGATFEVKSVINDWNEGATDYTIETSKEAFLKMVSEPINYIALDENSNCYDDDLWDCSRCIIAIGDKLFKIGSQRIAYERYGYSFVELSDYNKSKWPYLIKSSQAEPISFIRLEYEDHESFDIVMRLQIGDRPLLLTATDYAIMIGISHDGLNEEWIDFENNVLINGKQGN